MNYTIFMEKLIHEIEKRRAKRAFDTREIPKDCIQRIMQAALLAPSCFNNQPWRFIVADNPEALGRIKENLPGANYWVKKSPCIICACSKNDLDCTLSDNRNYAFFDLGLAAENLVLQAFKEGLIAHPIAGFKPVEIKKAFNIPDEYTLLALIILGYPGEEAHLNDKHLELEHSERERKPMEEVVFYNSWLSK